MLGRDNAAPVVDLRGHTITSWSQAADRRGGGESSSFVHLVGVVHLSYCARVRVSAPSWEGSAFLGVVVVGSYAGVEVVEQDCDISDAFIVAAPCCPTTCCHD